MKTLKKSLCLILVLSMVLSLGVITASADVTITDMDEVQHKEAVTVLNELGIITGRGADENGENKYDPSANINRAEAATIITRMLVPGANVPDSKSSFSDMADYAGMEKYVAYLEAQGIVAGMGDGTFNPGGNVTSAQFAKMILCALGYDASIENLVGPTWKINVAKLTRSISLDEDIDVDYDADLNRDDAAQFGLNGLKSTMVQYETKQTSNSDGTTGTEVTTRATNVTSTTNNARGNIKAGTTIELAEQSYPQLSLRNDVNDFGDLQKVWKNGTKTIAEGDILEPVIVYTEDKGTGDVKKDLVAYNFVTGGADQWVNTVENDRVITSTDEIAYLTGDGIEVKVYADSDNANVITNVVANSIYLAKVKSKNVAGEEAVLELQGVANTTATVNKTTNNKDYYDDVMALNKDDYVLIYAKGTGSAGPAVGGETTVSIQGIIGNAEKISGKVTSKETRDGNAWYTVNGKEYKVAQMYLGAVAAPPAAKIAADSTTVLNVDTTYDIYLVNGFIMGAEEQSESSNYAYILSKYNDGTRDEAKYQAQLLKSDGTIVWADIAAADGSTATAKLSNLYNNIEGGKGDFVKWSEGENGYDLKNVDDIAGMVVYTIDSEATATAAIATKLELVKGDTAPVLSTAPAVNLNVTADTVLLTEQDDGTFKSIKGVSSIPTKTIEEGYVLVDADGKTVMIVETSGNSASDSLYYIPAFNFTGANNSSATQKTIGNTKVTQRQVIKDGEFVKMYVNSDITASNKVLENKVYTSGSGSDTYIDKVKPSEIKAFTAADTGISVKDNQMKAEDGDNSAALFDLNTMISGKNKFGTTTPVYTDGTSLIIGSIKAVMASGFNAYYIDSTGKINDEGIAFDADASKNNALYLTRDNYVWVVLNADSAVKYVIITDKNGDPVQETDVSGYKLTSATGYTPATGDDILVDKDITIDTAVTPNNVIVMSGKTLTLNNAGATIAQVDNYGDVVLTAGTITTANDYSANCITVNGTGAKIGTLNLIGGKLVIAAAGKLTLQTALNVDGDSEVDIAGSYDATGAITNVDAGGKIKVDKTLPADAVITLGTVNNSGTVVVPTAVADKVTDEDAIQGTAAVSTDPDDTSSSGDSGTTATTKTLTMNLKSGEAAITAATPDVTALSTTAATEVKVTVKGIIAENGTITFTNASTPDHKVTAEEATAAGIDGAVITLSFAAASDDVTSEVSYTAPTAAPTAALAQVTETLTTAMTFGVPVDKVSKIAPGTATNSVYTPDAATIAKDETTVTFAGAQRTSGHYIAVKVQITGTPDAAATLKVDGKDQGSANLISAVKDGDTDGADPYVIAVLRLDDITAEANGDKNFVFTIDWDGASASDVTATTLKLNVKNLNLEDSGSTPTAALVQLTTTEVDDTKLTDYTYGVPAASVTRLDPGTAADDVYTPAAVSVANYGTQVNFAGQDRASGHYAIIKVAIAGTVGDTAKFSLKGHDAETVTTVTAAKDSTNLEDPFIYVALRLDDAKTDGEDFTFKFDWDADNTYDQTLTLKLTNVTLAGATG